MYVFPAFLNQVSILAQQISLLKKVPSVWKQHFMGYYDSRWYHAWNSYVILLAILFIKRRSLPFYRGISYISRSFTQRGITKSPYPWWIQSHLQTTNLITTVMANADMSIKVGNICSTVRTIWTLNPCCVSSAFKDATPSKIWGANNSWRKSTRPFRLDAMLSSQMPVVVTRVRCSILTISALYSFFACMYPFMFVTVAGWCCDVSTEAAQKST